MPRYRVEVVWVRRDWTEVEVEVEVEAAGDAVMLVSDMDDLGPDHLDTDPEVEVNVFPLPEGG